MTHERFNSGPLFHNFFSEHTTDISGLVLLYDPYCCLVTVYESRNCLLLLTKDKIFLLFYFEIDQIELLELDALEITRTVIELGT